MNTLLTKAGKHSDLAAAGAVVLVVAMMIIPLPPFLLDFFITLNISTALMIVVATMYVRARWTSPRSRALLLLTTLFGWPSYLICTFTTCPRAIQKRSTSGC